MLFCCMKTTRSYCVPKKDGSFGADLQMLKPTLKRYLKKQDEFMKSVYEDKEASASRHMAPVHAIAQS